MKTRRETSLETMMMALQSTVPSAFDSDEFPQEDTAAGHATGKFKSAIKKPMADHCLMSPKLIGIER